MPPSHLQTFYRTFDEVKRQRFDGMIVTGAPVETLAFEQEDYWPELCRVFEFSKNKRIFHAARVLGRTGGAVLPLRHPEI